MPVIVTLELFDSIHGTDAYTYLHTCSNQVAHVYDSVCVCVCLCTQNRYIQHIQTIFVAFAEEKKVEKKIFRSPKRANNDNNSNNKISNRFYTYYEERNSCCATEHRAPRSMQERFDKFIARD